MGMIVRDLHTLNIVNGEGFKALLPYLQPGCASDRHFMGLIEQKYADVRKSVKVAQQSLGEDYQKCKPGVES